MPDHDKECFVVGAIGEDGTPERIHADWLLEEIVEPVFESNWSDFRVVRADRIATPGLIDAQIIDRLLNDRIVIADLTFLNPNAFYEIGIRHVVQKPVIHVHRQDQRIPFDVSLFRSMKFSVAQPREVRAARENLTELLRVVLADGYQVENPVTKARGRVQFNETATPAQKVIQEEMRALSSRLTALEESSATFAAPGITGGRLRTNFALSPASAPKYDGSASFYIDSLDSADVIQKFISRYVASIVAPGVARVANLTNQGFDLQYVTGALPYTTIEELGKASEQMGITLIPF